MKSRTSREGREDFLAPLLSALETGRQGRPLLLLLDYDGTLVEIAPRPELARPAPELLELLGRLTSRADLKVMVVSGRPVSELQAILPVPGLDLLGSHGGEALLDGRRHPLPAAAVDSQDLVRWRQFLAAELQDFDGWWLEDKPQGFALHYRQVPEAHAGAFLGLLAAWQERLRQEGRFQILAGKKVLEILPPGVSKGSAIRSILLMPGFLTFFPVYLGDDSTDESAFRLLHNLGLTVKVGRTGIDTAASHFLPNPKSVRQFLARLAFPPEDCAWERF